MEFRVQEGVQFCHQPDIPGPGPDPRTAVPRPRERAVWPRPALAGPHVTRTHVHTEGLICMVFF